MKEAIKQVDFLQHSYTTEDKASSSMNHDHYFYVTSVLVNLLDKAHYYNGESIDQENCDMRIKVSKAKEKKHLEPAANFFVWKLKKEVAKIETPTSIEQGIKELMDKIAQEEDPYGEFLYSQNKRAANINLTTHAFKEEDIVCESSGQTIRNFFKDCILTIKSNKQKAEKQNPTKSNKKKSIFKKWSWNEKYNKKPIKWEK